MLDIAQVHDMDYVINNLNEVYELYKWVEEVLDKIKENVKTNKATLDLPTFEVVYSSYDKMVPVDINAIMAKYPISEYPDCYNISLSAKAGDVIMEPELVAYQPINTVKFKPKEE